MRYFASLSLLMLTIVWSEIAFSQRILLLDHKHKLKRFRFFEGDEIAFRIQGERFVVKGFIDMISDSTVVVNDVAYPVRLISEIRDYERYAALRAISRSAYIAIPPMAAITMLHRGLNTRESPLLDRNSLQVMGVFAGIGTLLLPFNARRYRTGKKWELRIIDITPG
jgi:hypothetical protein